ncbi:MAG TPA: SDR family NAD(P)-dependent oxidoreductase [Myxococcota bacterium]|nr:SDR family NAD(P)-dependent oxidoreductase [Myxococcota bacterium]
MSFSNRYGPWAIVAGASDGVGAAFARALAARGLNVVLCARRKALLDQVAAGIRADAKVETRTLRVDLAQPDAMSRVADASAGLEVGLLVYCAGADPNYQPFLANPVETGLAMVQRNCMAPMQMCHHFAGPMVARGRGGIVLFGSAAGFAGAPNLVAYGATKAFDMVFAEALWAELHEKGVDVLGLILGETDTPALRRLREQLGHRDDPDAPLRGAASAGDVVSEALAELANGPICLVGDQARGAAKFIGGMSRSDAVRFMIQASAAAMGSGAPRKEA